MPGSARVAFAAIALLSGFTLAAAADTGMSASTCSAKGRLASSASLWQPTNKLSLPVEQRVTAWEDIRQQGTTAKAPAGYVAKVGAAVPDTIATHPVPISTSNDVPKLGPYEYALFSNELLIVNPNDKTVAEIIRP